MFIKTGKYTNPFLKANTKFLLILPSTQHKLQKGMKLDSPGQPNQAVKRWHQIFEIGPNNSDALYLSVVVAHQLGSYNEAFRLIRLAIIFNPKVANFYAKIANAL